MYEISTGLGEVSGPFKSEDPSKLKKHNWLITDQSPVLQILEDPGAHLNPNHSATSSNLDHLGGLVSLMEALVEADRGCTSVMHRFRTEDKCYAIDADLVTDGGATWIKVVARNAKGTFTAFRGKEFWAVFVSIQNSVTFCCNSLFVVCNRLWRNWFQDYRISGWALAWLRWGKSIQLRATSGIIAAFPSKQSCRNGSFWKDLQFFFEGTKVIKTN